MNISNPPYGTFEGRNFMTPDIVRYGRVKPGVWYELSQGTGMSGGMIWGVTVRKSGGDRLDPDPSACCHSRAEAEDLIKELRG